MKSTMAFMHAAMGLLVAATLPSALGSRLAVRSEAGRKTALARELLAAGLPDPTCSSGLIALKEAKRPQVCCAGYCGECTDYPTCGSVRGQNSTNACCKSKVYEMRCGNAPANVCLKKCTESVPPCIMDNDEVFTTPDPSTRSAGSD